MDQRQILHGRYHDGDVSFQQGIRTKNTVAHEVFANYRGPGINEIRDSDVPEKCRLLYQVSGLPTRTPDGDRLVGGLVRQCVAESESLQGVLNNLCRCLLYTSRCV